jgi:hypothetical protein
LHLAAGNGCVGAVKFLLANEVNDSMRATSGAVEGLTAKQIAERKGKLKIVKIL